MLEGLTRFKEDLGPKNTCISRFPFVQGLSKEKPFFEPAERLDNLEKLHVKIGSGERDAVLHLAFPRWKQRVTPLPPGLSPTSLYPLTGSCLPFSWIGGTLSLGVAGGYTILFDDPEITYTTFEGWKHYRRFLNNPLLDKLPPYKLNTWNGQWLSYRYDEYFDKEDFNLGTLIDIKAIAQMKKVWK